MSLRVLSMRSGADVGARGKHVNTDGANVLRGAGLHFSAQSTGVEEEGAGR